MNTEPAYLTKAGLKARGWTDQLIRDHLGPPDKTAPNPRYRNASPALLFALTRITQAEASPGFRAAKQKAEARQRAAQAGVQTKTQQLEAYVEHLEISLPTLPLEVVARRAIRRYNERQAERHRSSPREPASLQSPPEFLHRLMVNYLRHAVSRYEQDLLALAGQVGAGVAYPQLKRKVLEAIAKAYPELAEECQRQQPNRRNEP